MHESISVCLKSYYSTTVRSYRRHTNNRIDMPHISDQWYFTYIPEAQTYIKSRVFYFNFYQREMRLSAICEKQFVCLRSCGTFLGKLCYLLVYYLVMSCPN